MDRDKRASGTAALLLGLVLLFEFGATLSLSLAGDDFELFALARIGGFSPLALFVPHRGEFVKPILNIAWATLVAAFGTRPALWHGTLLTVHLLDTALLGLLAARLSAAWRGRALPGASHRTDTLPDASSHPERGVPDGRPLDIATGFAAAGIWGVHDRLSEPVFSVASLNHSLTFVFYLAALLALLKAIGTREARDRLLLALCLILALFSYEIAVSLVPAAILLLLLDRRRPPSESLVSLGPALALAASLFAAVHLFSRLGRGTAAPSYYAFTPSLAAANLSEIGSSFLHLSSDWIEPGVLPAVVFAGILLLLLLRLRDPIVRFGLGWSLASWLPVAAIPHFSDRYHYIAFAGLALAAGRGAALALVPARDREPTAPLVSRLSPASAAPVSASAITVSGASPPPSSTSLPADSSAAAPGVSASPAFASLSAASSADAPGAAPSPASTSLSAASSAGASDISPSPASASPASPTSPPPAHSSTPFLLRASARPLVLLLLLAHFLWSLGGARELASYHRLRGAVPESLLQEARAVLAVSHDPGPGGANRPSAPNVTTGATVLALVWHDDPDFYARFIQAGEARPSIRLLGPLSAPFRFGERSHPIYVRGDGILGAVYPLDLLNVAGASQGVFFRTPKASVAAHAIAGETLRVFPLALGGRRRPELPALILRQLRDSLLTRREIPVRLPPIDDEIATPLRTAYLERTDRAGAFGAEYGP